MKVFLSKMIQQSSRVSYQQEKSAGLGERHALIIRALTIGGPMTDQEIRAYLNVSDPNFVRPRRFELSDEAIWGIDQAPIYARFTLDSAGKKRYEKKICSVTGKSSILWRVRRHEPQQMDLFAA